MFIETAEEVVDGDDLVYQHISNSGAGREKEFLEAILDELEEEPPHGAPKAIAEKLASMACKSAVKGNHSMSREEMASLLEQLLQLENPYHCPHGRPTIITMSKYELERKFKRII